jgi:hypothetical protein
VEEEEEEVVVVVEEEEVVVEVLVVRGIWRTRMHAWRMCRARTGLGATAQSLARASSCPYRL